MTGVPVALTRCPAPSLAEGELTFLDRQPIAIDLAEKQHAAYCDALAALGLEVVTLPAVTAYPDSVFVEDMAVVLDEVVVLTRPGAASRQGEAALMADALSRYRPVLPLVPLIETPAPRASSQIPYAAQAQPGSAAKAAAVAGHEAPALRGVSHRGHRSSEPATLEGGDVLRVGRRLFVGISSRTNAAGVGALRNVAAPYGYTVTPVPVTGCLHLKTGVTALDDTTLLANPAWVDLSPFAGMEILPVDEAEPWAANVLRHGHSLLASAAYPRTAELLDRRGYAPNRVDISEFAKAEAGLTCLSLLFA